MISAIGFNPYIMPNQMVDPAIKTQLDALGLKPTGSKQGDLAAIQAAKSSQTQNSNNKNIADANKVSTQIPPQNQSIQQVQPPWAELMQKLGLTLTGSKESDIAAITKKLQTLEAQATSPDQKAEVATLKAEFQAITSAEASSGSNQVNTQSNAFAGQNQLAELNKFFLIQKV